MSDEWGDDDYDVDQVGDLVDQAVDDVEQVAPGRPAVSPGAGPDLLDAMATVEAAERGVREAQDRLDAAVDGHADAGGATRVAQAKLEDYETAEDKESWQLVAAHEALAKAERREARAGALVERRQAEVSTAADRLASARQAVNAVVAAGVAVAAGDDAPQLYYTSVDEFVREYLRNIYRRRIDARSRYWAAAWWRYDEAVIRLEALWRAWEHLRLDPSTGMSVWWRDHADHHMAVLMDPAGPFSTADCEDDKNARGEPLPYVAPPIGMFPDVRSSAD